MKQEHKVGRLRFSIDNHTLFRILTFILVYIGIILFVWSTRQVWVLLIVAFFLALALNPPVSWPAKKLFRGRRGLATGIAYLLVLSVLGILLYATVPPLVDQTQQLYNNLPEYIENLRTSDNGA